MKNEAVLKKLGYTIDVINPHRRRLLKEIYKAYTTGDTMGGND